PNAVTTLTGVAFSDNLPAGLVVATPNGQSGTCTGAITDTAGSSTLSPSGSTLAASASCTLVVDVKGSPTGSKAHTTGVGSATESGAGTTSNTATVTVVAPPTISKAFGTGTITVNASTALTFTITNPNAGTALTGIAFTDTLVSGLVVATPNGLTSTCGGTAT